MWACEADAEDALFTMMGARWTATHVENGRGNPGFADIVYSYKGARGFIEMKYVDNLQHSTAMRIGLTREQADFLKLHGEAAGHCHVILGVGRGQRFYRFGWQQADDLLTPKQPRVILEWAELIEDLPHLLRILRRP